MLTQTEENYLKAIFHLSGTAQETATTNAISDSMQTTAATVTDMIKKLADKKLLSYKKYYGAKLTAKGRQLAIKIIRKHRLWEVFLVQKLNFRWDEVHEIAEQLEHVSSDEMITRLDKYLNHPKLDPHGDPIPDRKGKFTAAKQVPLSKLKINAEGTVSGVTEHSPAFLQYLQKQDLMPGSYIQIIGINDFDHSLELRINRRQKKYISNDVSKNILITGHLSL